MASMDQGYSRDTMVMIISVTTEQSEVNLKTSPQFRLWTEIRPYEGGIVSNHKLVCYGEFVTQSCTDRPSRAGT